jgi:hypothetical protein
MARFAGRRVAVGIGIEDEAGTPQTPDYWYPHLDVSLKDTPSPLYNESAHGTIVKNNEKINTLIEGDGSISGKMYAKGLYYFLALVFGQLPDATDIEDGAWQYDFALQDDNEHLSATLAVKDPNLDLDFPFGMIESFTITWAPDDYPKIEMAIKSAKSQSGSNTPAYIVDSEFLPKMAALYIDDALGDLDTADALTTIKSFSLTFTKTLSPQQTMDSGDTYGEINNTDFEVTGTIEKLYSDTTYRGLDLNDTVKAMRFALIDSNNLAGSTPTPTSLTFDFSQVAFDSHEPARGLSDISTETLNFSMLLDKSDFEDTIKAILINKYTYI